MRCSKTEGEGAEAKEVEDPTVKLLVKQNADGSYSIERTDEGKDKGFDFTKVKFIVKVGKLPIIVEKDPATPATGEITIAEDSQHTKGGRYITATIKGNDEKDPTTQETKPRRPVESSVKAIVVDKNGTKITETKGVRNDNGTWSFLVPGDAPEDGKILITSQFEYGSDNPATTPVSAGVAVGVAVVLAFPCRPIPAAWNPR